MTGLVLAEKKQKLYSKGSWKVLIADNSGLKLVKFIREELKNPSVRIILRTGYPGKVPAQQVIIETGLDNALYRQNRYFG